MKNKTYFLFGSDACQVLLHEGEDALLSWVEDETGFDVFCYEESFTSPVELLNSFEGWAEYTVITEELYNKILEL